MSRTTHRLAVAIGTLLATAALASSASADPHAQDTHMRELQAAGKTTPHVVQDLRSPDARDAAERRAPVVVRVDRAPDTGISWDSAGIGALVSAGIVFSLVGAFVLATRRRTRSVHPA
jgi:hypothetical protein